MTNEEKTNNFEIIVMVEGLVESTRMPLRKITTYSQDDIMYWSFGGF